MEASTDLFINLIQNNRILYDKSLKDFKNTRKKEEVWQNIAAQSRMSVDAAKKRYFSLRQKYSREKRNIEVKRRNKTGTVRYWVYFERLHFLDSFIQPRPTYTNDTKFEEDDEPMDGTGTLSYTNTPNIEIELEDGIGNNELNYLFGENERASSDIHQHSNGQTVESCQNDNSNDNSELITTECILSEYTGEISTCEYLASQKQNDENNDTAIVTNEGPLEVPIDMDNYVSPFPGTSSSQAMITSLHRNDSKGRSLSAPTDSDRSSNSKQQPPNKSIDTHSLQQQRNYLSAPKATIPAKASVGQDHVRMLEYDENTDPAFATIDEQFRESLHGNDSNQQPRNKSIDTRSLQQQRNYSAPSAIIPSKASVGQGKVRMLDRTVHSNRTATPIAPAAHQTVSSRADVATSAASNEKRIEAIRQRMESCLTAITNKVTEKGQRSPHAPFLAYLGTKLPNVPVEILPGLEKEILELVDRLSS